MTEQQLIERCKKQDAKAMKALYELYADRMMGICYRYVTDRDVARDLLHDGFITVFTKINDFRNEGSFEGWMRRVFVNTALGYIRKNHGKFQDEPVEEMYALNNADASVIDELAAENILNAIARLPAGYRTVLNMYAVEGYSHKEIAETLGISENTSRTQYMRAKQHLVKLLKEPGASER